MHTTSIPAVGHSRDPAFGVLPKQHRQHESTHQQPESVESDCLPSSFTRRQGEMMGFRDDYDSSLWVRPEPWWTLLHGDDCEAYAAGDIEGRRLDEHLQDCKLAAASLGEPEMVSIMQDVRRTRAETTAFRDEAVQDWLVHCVTLFCQERGLPYSQGISELAAPWAMITDPPSLNGFSYRCFCRFMDRFAPNMFIVSGRDVARGSGEKKGLAWGEASFVVLEAHLLLFEHLLRYHDPALATHLEESRISADAYATPWFVTIFARQTPIPVILHLWKRLLENGEPALHQFLALGWLLSNRMLLLATPRDDIPEVVTRLRFQSTGMVDSVFKAALALRRLTPRLFCDTLGKVCYKGMEGSDADDGRQGRQGELNFRVSLLRSLREKGVVQADAGQLAEILLASPRRRLSSSKATMTSPSDINAMAEGDNSRDWVGNGYGGRFVLVDCRGLVNTKSSASDAIPEELAEIVDGVEVGSRVVWLRLDPEECLARESTAVAQMLRDYLGPFEPRVGANGRLSFEARRSSLDATDGVDGESSTHVCFIGSQTVSTVAGDWVSDSSDAGAAATSPAYRLAQTASRVCSIPRVCVLDGGFAALQDAITARRSGEFRAALSAGVLGSPAQRDYTHTGTDDGGDAVVVASSPAVVGVDLRQEGDKETEKVATSPRHNGEQHDPEVSPGTKAAGTTPLGISEVNGSTGQGGSAPPRRAMATPAHSFERKLSRLVSKRRISEPFRVYAAKSADDMGRALRILPATAGKPLEDAARVCSSLAKGNVKILGDSRLSLSRSLRNLEQLDARMDGTAAGFARNFGTGLRR